MKKTLALLLTLLIASGIEAQNVKRFWSDGPLTVADFPVKGESHMAWYMGYTKIKEKSDGVYYTYYKVVTYVLPYSSALDSEADLPRMQLLFDRLELHRRELQQQLNEAENNDEFDDLLSAARKRMANDEQTLQPFTLDALPASPIPQFTDKRFRFGVAASVLSGYPLLFDVATGVEMAWNRHVALLNLHYGLGLDRSIASAGIGYGFTVYETSHVRITPYVTQGIGLFSAMYGTDTMSSATAVPQIGVNMDIPFYTHIITQSGNSGLFSFLASNHSLYCVRMTFYLQHIDWGRTGSGWSANFGIGLSFLGRNTRPARNQ